MGPDCATYDLLISKRRYCRASRQRAVERWNRGIAGSRKLCERLWWAVLGISLAVYVMAQIAATDSWLLLLPGWNFQPLAWQFLLVFAAIQGQKFGASGSTGWPHSRMSFVAAVLVLLLGLVVKKSDWLPFKWSSNLPMLQNQIWTGKLNWAPLRGLRHLSLVYATVYLMPLSSQI